MSAKPLPPDLDELSFLFGCEPTLLDPDSPWSYSTISFRIERDGAVATCELALGYSTIKINMCRDGLDIARAELSDFSSLEILQERGREMLIARFADGRGAVMLALKPELQLTMAF